MQGQRGTVGSLPETFFDHGSTSSNAAIEQQICWNNIRNPIEDRFPDCLLSPNDMSIGYVNSIAREEQELGRWNMGEASSSGTQNEVSHNEQKTNPEWSSSLSASANAGPRLEERRYEQNSLFVQNCNSDAVPQNLNLNAGLVGHGDNNCQIADLSNLYKPSGSENERIASHAGPEAFLLSSGSGGYVVDDNDSRPGCSYEGRRASCKRKALEGNVGQSSSSGSSSYFHHAESSAWHGVAPSYSAGGNVNISAPSGQVHPRLGLDVRGSASDSIPEPVVLPAAESSHRNFRLRINPSIPEPIAPLIFSIGDTARQSVVSSSQQSSRLLPTDHSLDLRSTPVVDNASPQNPNVVLHVPILPRNVQPFRWNGGYGSRTGSSSSNVSGDRDAVPREGHQSRSIARNVLDHPMYVPAPELRTLVRNPTSRGLSSGNISVPGNGGSTSRAGSSSGANASSASTWVPRPNPSTQYYTEDIFNSSLNLEEAHYQEGYSEGYNHGITIGKEEASQVGLKTGFETGEKLGFYKGCVDVWNSSIQIDPIRFSPRVQKGIKQMQELIQKYPVMDPENESVQEIMEALKLKFRVIRAAMGVKLEYDGYPKPKDIEF